MNPAAAHAPRLDPVTLEVLWNRLVSIVQEAETVLLRTSFSSTVGEANDYAAALLDARGQILTQTPKGTPGFIAILGRMTRRMLEYFPLSTLEPGDVLITNDPWICAGHLPDVNLLTPIFYRGAVVAFAASTAHLNDVGGRGSAQAVDLFEEGLRIPPSKLYRAGAPNRDVLNFIQANSRTPKQIVGDLHAQLAANATADKRLVETLEEHGLADLQALSDAIQERTERAVREVLRRLPAGSYRAELWGDGYEEGVRIAVEVRVIGDGTLEVDYAGTSPQVPRAINCPFNLTYAATMFPFRCMTPNVPTAEGALRPIRVFAPEGCIVNPTFPAAVLRRSVVIHNVHAAIFRALAPLAPEFIPADRVIAHSGCIFSFRFTGEWTGAGRAYRRGVLVNDGRFAQTYLFMGGQGATLASDGRNTLTMPANCSNVPIEVMEARAPVLYECKEWCVDSGGPGRYRGGLGQRVTIRALADDAITFVPSSIRGVQYPAPGIEHGASGGRAGLKDPDTGKRVHPRVPKVMPTGTRVTVWTSGGGGAGEPTERDPRHVADDVRLEYVTQQAARRHYRVVLTRDGAVDLRATTRLRQRHADAVRRATPGDDA